MAQKTVLLAEDDLEIRDILQDLLEAEGYDVVPASHGRQALEFLAGARGREAARPRRARLDDAARRRHQVLDTMKSDPVLAPIPVVVLSAVARERPVGAAAFLRKPIPLQKFFDTIKGFVEAGLPRRPRWPSKRRLAFDLRGGVAGVGGEISYGRRAGFGERSGRLEARRLVVLGFVDSTVLGCELATLAQGPRALDLPEAVVGDHPPEAAFGVGARIEVAQVKQDRLPALRLLGGTRSLLGVFELVAAVLRQRLLRGTGVAGERREGHVLIDGARLAGLPVRHLRSRQKRRRLAARDLGGRRGLGLGGGLLGLRLAVRFAVRLERLLLGAAHLGPDWRR